jgi:hypothetical protein
MSMGLGMGVGMRGWSGEGMGLREILLRLFKN